jgi:apolipoprotein N-acyltransferase
VVAPAASALLLALSYPPLHLPLLPFTGLTPLALWIATRSSDDEGRAAATRGAGLFGGTHATVVCWWAFPALRQTTGLAVPLFLAGVLLVGVVAALFGRALHHVVLRGHAPLWLSLPVLWTGFEWTMAHLPGGLAFPWLGLGTSLTGLPDLVGIAELVGARGVTFWVALVNGFVAVAVLRGRSGVRPARYVLLAVTVLALPMVWGGWRARALEADVRSLGRLAVVQTDVPGSLRLHDRAAARDSARAALARLLPTIRPGSVGLIVLPEVVLPIEPEGVSAAADLELLRRHAEAIEAPILFGAWGRDPDGDRGREGVRYNSAFLMGGRGLDDFRYDKHRLVPLVEHVPILTQPFVGRQRNAGPYAEGKGRPLAVAGGHTFAVLICFESAFAADARAARNAGADVLVNITSDAWFGTEPAQARTTVLWQHPAHMVMRAIENRVGVARASNRGISLFIDPIGRVHGATRPFEEAVQVAEVTTTDITTLYARLGDVTGTACGAVSLVVLVASFWGGSWGPRRRVGPSSAG